MDIWGLIIYLLNLLFAFLQALIRQPMPGPTTMLTTMPTTMRSTTPFNATRCPPGNILLT